MLKTKHQKHSHERSWCLNEGARQVFEYLSNLIKLKISKVCLAENQTLPVLEISHIDLKPSGQLINKHYTHRRITTTICIFIIISWLLNKQRAS